MRILDEIIDRVQGLTYDQQKEVLKNLQSLQGSDKRKYPRLRINTDIDAVIDDRVIQSNTRDISAGGVYIMTTGKLETGKMARVVFVSPGYETPIKLHGKSVRVEKKGIAIKFKNQFPYDTGTLDDVIRKMKTV